MALHDMLLLLDIHSSWGFYMTKIVVEGNQTAAEKETIGFANEISKFSSKMLTLIEIANIVMAHLNSEIQVAQTTAVKIMTDNALSIEEIDNPKVNSEDEKLEKRFEIPISKVKKCYQLLLE